MSAFDIQTWAELSLVSAERHWTAQPEHLHSTEVPDEQVGIQQLQLGGQLTSAVRVHPTALAQAKHGAGSSLLLSLLTNSPLLLQIPSPVSGPSTCATLPVVRGGAVLREPAMQWCMMGGRDGRGGWHWEGRSKLHGYWMTPSRGEIFILRIPIKVSPTSVLFSFSCLFSKRMNVCSLLSFALFFYLLTGGMK